MIIGNHLSEDESQQLQRVVNQYQDCFRTDQLGASTQFKHTINTGDHKLIHVPPYRQSRERRAITKELVREFLEQGLTQISNSP